MKTNPELADMGYSMDKNMDESMCDYVKPELKKLGNMAKVTQKSGTPPDQQQVTKPGGGGG